MEADKLRVVFRVLQVTIVLLLVDNRQHVQVVNTQTNRHQHVQPVQLTTTQLQEWQYASLSLPVSK